MKAALKAIPANATINLTYECPKCDGYGVVCAWWCKKCGRRLTQEEYSTLTDRLRMTSWKSINLCGHSLDHLAEEDTCPDCGGSGEIIQKLTVQELKEILDAA
jgi:DnaJ-class molecular chaperone